MKQLLIIILSSFAILVCCTAKYEDPENVEQGAFNAQIQIDTIYITEGQDEGFIDFLKKFHTDTVFQQQRLNGIIRGYNGENDSLHYYYLDDIYILKNNYTWDRQTVAPYLRRIDGLVADTVSQIRRYILIRSDSVTEEEFYVNDKGIISSICTFENKGEKWFLTELFYNLK